MGRRVSKSVYAWDAQAGDYAAAPAYTRKFLWAGWRLLAELDDDDRLLRSYVWRLTASGGVGGLLGVCRHAPSTGDVTATHYPAFDHNGNVRAWVDADTGETVASFEYTPFGRVLTAESAPGASSVTPGDPTAISPLLHATKYYDVETGLYYYGHRYYDPRRGRWLNRDPLGEQGGVNLYAFCMNDPINAFDPLGLEFTKEEILGAYRAIYGEHDPWLRAFHATGHWVHVGDVWGDFDIDRHGRKLEVEVEEDMVRFSQLCGCG